MQSALRRFIVGINGGHQHAHAVVLDTEATAEGARISDFPRLDPINPHYLTVEHCIERYDRLLKSLARFFGLPQADFIHQISHVVLSVAGAIPNAISGPLNRDLCQMFDCHTLRVVDDTWAGMYAETSEEKGICAFAGAGASVSIALGEFDPSRRFKLDGWGPIIGDFGSGFQLVIDYFRHLGRCRDRECCPVSFPAVAAFTDVRVNATSRVLKLPTELSAVQEWFDKMKETYPADWHVRFADLAEPLLRYCDSHPADKTVSDLVVSCAQELLKTIEVAIDRFPEECRNLQLVLQGEMFNSDLYRSVVEAAAYKWVNHRRLRSVQRARYGPAYGALSIACAAAGYTNSFSAPDRPFLRHDTDVNS